MYAVVGGHQVAGQAAKLRHTQARLPSIVNQGLEHSILAPGGRAGG